MLNTENSREKFQSDTTAIILTYNEEQHIERCILSVKNYVKRILVIDSFSSDNTIDICKKYNVDILQNKFVNHAKQINWSLEKADINTNWILRIDADEIITKNLGKKISQDLPKLTSNISGVSINRKIKFLKKEINFGGTSPHKTLRIWRNGKGKCEDLWLDEQIIVDGKVFHINENLIDNNLNDLSWWLKKHKTYAAREAISFLLTKNHSHPNVKPSTDRSKLKKYYKIKIYYKFPIFIRPFLLFFYNYLIKLGFLSGWQGLIFYFFQILWFRFLVDVNISQLKKMTKVQKITLAEAVKKKYGYEQI